LLRESVSIENEHAFFPLLDTVTDPNTPPSAHTLTAEAIHGLVVETTARLGLLPKAGSLAFADINLALHTATPKIEAFYQYYTDHHGNKDLGGDCRSWVDWYGQVVCDLETLEKLADIDTIDEATTHPYVISQCTVVLPTNYFQYSVYFLDPTSSRLITYIPQVRV
jgi:UDP-glucose:glycoprotein glucosyltransferase